MTLVEEQLDAILFVGWRQVSATLQITHGGATEHIATNMQDLREALLRDSDLSADAPAAPATAAKSQSPRVREMLHLRRSHTR